MKGVKIVLDIGPMLSVSVTYCKNTAVIGYRMRKPFFKVSYDYALDNSVTEHGYIGIYTRTPECRLCKSVCK